MAPIHDPSLEHQMQVRMLGNGWVYVTCNCLLRVAISEVRKHGGKRTKTRRTGLEYSAMTSLGDFPVGTPIERLLEAYNLHLRPDQDWTQ